MAKIVINKNKCIGCLNCKHTCYEVFDIDSDGKAIVRYGCENSIEEAQTAIINCPTGAISIVNNKKHKSNSNLLYILIILVVFYSWWFIAWKIDNFKGDEYIPSTKYNDYVINIALNHIDNSIFEFVGEKIDTPSNNEVVMKYSFTTDIDEKDYEKYAYDEVKYVYDLVKDIKIKKDGFSAPKGKDLIFIFYTNQDKTKKEIGRATIFYYFGKLHGEDYIEGTDKIIFNKI